MNEVPDRLLDADGYPTPEWLKYISDYTDKVMPIMQFVQCVLIDGWHFSEWGFRLHRTRNGIRKLELHTGGWSGNEETIMAILGNIYLTHFKMQYVKWTRGGHYYFEIKVK